MENKPTIKAPIPTTSPFRNFALARIPSLRGCTCLHPDPSGIHLLYSVFCLLPSVSCLLSSVFCLQPNTPILPIMPQVNRVPPVRTANALLLCLLTAASGCDLCGSFFLPFCVVSISCKFVQLRGSLSSSCLRGYKSIMQNKPNSPTAKTTATSYVPKSYNNIALRQTRKNKPKQTQSQPKIRALLDPERSRRANRTQLVAA